jgi:predicted enzyme related to lactoylglutathione lyase
VLFQTAGTTIISTKAKEAIDFYVSNFDVHVNDYGAGADTWYWTLTFAQGAELSFMMPVGLTVDLVGEFDGKGTFYWLLLSDATEVDALHAKLASAGAKLTPIKTEDMMYQFWVTDPAGLPVMVHSHAVDDA